MCTCTYMMIHYIKKYTIAEFMSYGRAGQVAQEIMSSVRPVVALGLQRKSRDAYKQNLAVSEQMSRKKGLVVGVFGALQIGLLNCCFGIGVYYAVYILRTECQTFDVTDVMSSFFAVVTSSFSIGQALPFLTELSAARGAAKKVYAILDTKSAIDVLDKANATKRRLPEGRSGGVAGNIRFEGVHFAYPARAEAPILKGLDLNIPAGKTVALVGSR